MTASQTIGQPTCLTQTRHLVTQTGHHPSKYHTPHQHGSASHPVHGLASHSQCRSRLLLPRKSARKPSRQRCVVRFLCQHSQVQADFVLLYQAPSKRPAHYALADQLSEPPAPSLPTPEVVPDPQPKPEPAAGESSRLGWISTIRGSIFHRYTTGFLQETRSVRGR